AKHLKDNDGKQITTGRKDKVNLDNPGSDLKGVLSGYDFLASVYMEGVDNYLKNPKYDLGSEIVVIGGGDTSLDCARTALRLAKGRGNVTVLYKQPETELHVNQIRQEEE